jgi:hypothetical protein
VLHALPANDPLIELRQQAGGAIGTATMSVILTGQVLGNRAASAYSAVTQAAARRPAGYRPMADGIRMTGAGLTGLWPRSGKQIMGSQSGSRRAQSGQPVIVDLASFKEARSAQFQDVTRLCTAQRRRC